MKTTFYLSPSASAKPVRRGLSNIYSRCLLALSIAGGLIPAANGQTYGQIHGQTYGQAQGHTHQQTLGPLVLVRPLANESIQRLFDEADSLYLAKQVRQAQDGFEQLLELEPKHAQGWLRLGNLLQQKSDLTGAMRAYRKSIEAARPSHDAVGYKALFNLAQISLQRATDAIEELEQWQAVRPVKAEFDTSATPMPQDDQVLPRLLTQKQMLVGALKTAIDHQPASMVQLQAPSLPRQTTAQTATRSVASIPNEAPVAAEAPVPVYQGWSNRRTPGSRQLAMPSDESVGKKPSKAVLRPVNGVATDNSPAHLIAPKPRVLELPARAGQPSVLGPEVIYLKGGSNDTKAAAGEPDRTGSAVTASGSSGQPGGLKR
jgi:hypothetical protein